MQILNNQSNINFNGAFRFKPNDVKAKTDVPQLFTQGRQIFHDVLEKGDEVVVIRDNYDKRVGRYLKENPVSDVEYYPEINTKCGLDDEEPEGLAKLIRDKAVVVKKNIDEILERISTQKTSRTMRTHSVKKEIVKIADALRLNIENPQITSNRSFTKVRDEAKKRTIEIIAPDRGLSYVHVIPDSLNESTTKCILDKRGEVVKFFNTPRDIHKFNKAFRELKKQNVNHLADK